MIAPIIEDGSGPNFMGPTTNWCIRHSVAWCPWLTSACPALWSLKTRRVASRNASSSFAIAVSFVSVTSKCLRRSEILVKIDIATWRSFDLPTRWYDVNTSDHCASRFTKFEESFAEHNLSRTDQSHGPHRSSFCLNETAAWYIRPCWKAQALGTILLIFMYSLGILALNHDSVRRSHKHCVFPSQATFSFLDPITIAISAPTLIPCFYLSSDHFSSSHSQFTFTFVVHNRNSERHSTIVSSLRSLIVSTIKTPLAIRPNLDLWEEGELRQIYLPK